MDDDDARFLNDFLTAVLPFEKWTHAAHVRMAYLICRSSCNFEEALSHIRLGIQKFNQLHVAKLTVGFHETMTQLWTKLIWDATQQYKASNSNDFIEHNHYLLDSSLWKHYYSPSLMFSSDAKQNFLPPDLKSISLDTQTTI